MQRLPTGPEPLHGVFEIVDRGFDHPAEWIPIVVSTGSIVPFSVDVSARTFVGALRSLHRLLAYGPVGA